MEGTQMSLAEKLELIVAGVRPQNNLYVTDDLGVVYSSPQSWLERKEADDPHDK